MGFLLSRSLDFPTSYGCHWKPFTPLFLFRDVFSWKIDAGIFVLVQLLPALSAWVMSWAVDQRDSWLNSQLAGSWRTKRIESWNCNFFGFSQELTAGKMNFTLHNRLWGKQRHLKCIHHDTQCTSVSASHRCYKTWLLWFIFPNWKRDFPYKFKIPTTYYFPRGKHYFPGFFPTFCSYVM